MFFVFVLMIMVGAIPGSLVVAFWFLGRSLVWVMKETYERFRSEDSLGCLGIPKEERTYWYTRRDNGAQCWDLQRINRSRDKVGSRVDATTGPSTVKTAE